MNIVRFFTHHKCATKWLGNVLFEYAQGLGVEFYHTHYSDKFLFNKQGIQLYTSADYEMIPLELRSGIHIIRNPIDIVVSSYFSHLKSHSLDGWPELQEMRNLLKKLDKEKGIYADLIFLERSDFYNGAIAPLKSIRTWNYEDHNFINLRMEDLVEDPYSILTIAFEKFEHKVNANLLIPIIEKYSFVNLSEGRVQGEQNVNSHYRSGKANDGLNHLTSDQMNLIRNLYSKIFDRFYKL